MFNNFVVMNEERRPFLEAARPIFERIMAQRAYDLIRFASECINDKQLEEGMRLTPEYMIECIPDLTEWPEET